MVTPWLLNRHLFGFHVLKKLYVQCLRCITCSSSTVWIKHFVTTQFAAITMAYNLYFQRPMENSVEVFIFNLKIVEFQHLMVNLCFLNVLNSFVSESN